MGSLMPGWSAKHVGPEDELKRCNSSLTKEEVERYWRLKRTYIQEHEEEVYRLSPRGSMTVPVPIPIVLIPDRQRLDISRISTSLPASTSSSSSPSSPSWWTRSKWACLNEPPSVLGQGSKYVPQFDVATKGQMQIDHPPRTLSGIY